MANPIDLNAFLAAGGTQTVIDEMTVILTNRKATRDKFPCWTIEIGTHATVEALVADIEASEAKFNNWARTLLPQVTISPVRRTLQLVAPSVPELGFTKAAPLREVYARAIETYGLELCPSEAALQICRQYTTQQKGKRLSMAMEAVEDSDRSVLVFDVGHGGDAWWIYIEVARPENIYYPDRRLVFVLPQAA